MTNATPCLLYFQVREERHSTMSDMSDPALEDDYDMGDGARNGYRLSDVDRKSLCVVGRGVKLHVDVPVRPDDAFEGTADDCEALTGDVMLIDGCAVPITPMPSSALSQDSTDWLALYTTTKGSEHTEVPQPPTPLCAALIDAFMPPTPGSGIMGRFLTRRC